jgi:hypothetical protein
MSYTSRTLGHRRREADRHARANHFGGGMALGALLMGSLALFAIQDAQQDRTPKPATRVVEVLIGTGCPAGNGPGMQVVSDTWSDAALDGCKEIEAHDFEAEVR